MLTSKVAFLRRLDLPYCALTSVLLVAMCVPLAKVGSLSKADIWTHAAAVRAFMESPLDPLHPVLGIDAPDPFLTPYTAVLGVFARVAGATAMEILMVAGAFNLLLFSAGLWLFVRCFSSSRHAPAAALVFTLVWWGAGPWEWGGFMHLGGLWRVLPMPSTFAKSLGLVSAASYLSYLKEGGRLRLALPAAAGPVMLTAHPIDGVYFLLFVAASALFADRSLSQRQAFRSAAVIGVIALGGALLWPFYRIEELLITDSTFRDVVASDERLLYDSVVARTWPTLLLGAAVWPRLRRLRRDPLLVTLGVLVAFWAGGALEFFPAGRLIAFIVTLIHVIAAVELARLWQRVQGHHAAVRSTMVLVLCALTAIGAWNVRAGLSQTFPPELSKELLGVTPRPLLRSADFARIFASIDEHAVVMTGPGFGKPIPAITGASLVSASPTFGFVVSERKQDVDQFFFPHQSVRIRSALIRKYCVTHIVYPSYSKDDAALADLGTVSYADAIHTVVAVAKDPGCSARLATRSHR